MPAVVARKQGDVAAVIKAARERAGLTQQALAHELAFPRDYMVDLESGAGNTYTYRLFRVLHELGVTLTLSFGDDDA